MRFLVVRGKRRAAAEPAGTWIKSSFSSYTGNCVEVAGLVGNTILVRDSKNPSGGALSFTPAEWDAFIDGVRNGEFNRKPR
jgi:hypothetical protein